MVSDFFHPSIGGVETHIFQLSRHLIAAGHRVVVVTTMMGGYNGVHRLPIDPVMSTNGDEDDVHDTNEAKRRRWLKVYYLSVPKMYNGSTWPTFFSTLPALLRIFRREQVELVHAHQAFSTLAHEALLHARSLGLATCFTDHSLFGFADGSSIITNKWLKFTMSDVDRVICVSHCSKENTVLRAALEADSVYVIPNAVLADSLPARPALRSRAHVTIVVLSRLVYRKGIDLLVDIIPTICARYGSVRWIVAGDGPKRVDLEQCREQHLLHDRVEFLGAVPSSAVPNVLARGDIFLNTSLTEAFCMAIVEAACCGLQVVSTRVGGVPEVLPAALIRLAHPDVGDLVHHVSSAIEHELELRASGRAEERFYETHRQVQSIYSWPDVTRRTLTVYRSILSDYAPRIGSCSDAGQGHECPDDKDLAKKGPLAGETPLLERLARYYGCGEWAGKAWCCVVLLDYLLVYTLTTYLGY